MLKQPVNASHLLTYLLRGYVHLKYCCCLSGLGLSLIVLVLVLTMVLFPLLTKCNRYHRLGQSQNPTVTAGWIGSKNVNSELMLSQTTVKGLSDDQ